MGIISLVFNRPGGGRFNKKELSRQKNTLIKVVDVSTGGGLQKQQTTSQGGGNGSGLCYIFGIFGHVIDVL